MEVSRHERAYEYWIGRDHDQYGRNRHLCGKRRGGVFRNCGDGGSEHGLVKLLRRDSLKHGINVTVNENKISLEFHVIVSYGVSIQAVADNLISNVKYKVEEFTGMEIEDIHILVEGVRVID